MGSSAISKQTFQQILRLPPNYHDMNLVWTSANQITIKAGSQCRSQDDSYNIIFASDYIIDMSNATPTSSQGGRTVAEAANTTYYIYVGLDSSGNPLAWFDTANLVSGGTPTNPAAFSLGRRQIQRKIRNDGSSNISVISVLDGFTANPVLIQEQIVSSAVASVAFTIGITNQFKRYEFELFDVLPSTNDVSLIAHSSSNGGSSYDSTGGDYVIANFASNSAGSSVASTSGSSGAFQFTQGVAGGWMQNNVATHGLCGNFTLFDPSTSGKTRRAHARTSYLGSGSNEIQNTFSGYRNNTLIINALRFSYSSGNIASGTFRLYGVN
jgi:hypothetical protein